MSGNLFSIIITVLIVIIVVFLICRELICWYWKINRIVVLLEEQNKFLQDLLIKNSVSHNSTDTKNDNEFNYVVNKAVNLHSETNEDQNKLLQDLLIKDNVSHNSTDTKNDNEFNYVVNKAVNLRSETNLDSSVIKKLLEGTKLTIIEKGQNYKINDVVSPLVKVRTENNEIGWCFSQFLKKV